MSNISAMSIVVTTVRATMRSSREHPSETLHDRRNDMVLSVYARTRIIPVSNSNIVYMWGAPVTWQSRLQLIVEAE